MTKYINAEKLKAEIERRRLSNRYIDTEGYENELLEIIDSLQQEQSSLPDNLDEAAEEYEDWVESYCQSDFPTCVSFRQAFKAGAEWMAKQGVSMEVVSGVPWRAVDAFIHDHDYMEDSIIQIRKK